VGGGEERKKIETPNKRRRKRERKKRFTRKKKKIYIKSKLYPRFRILYYTNQKKLEKRFGYSIQGRHLYIQKKSQWFVEIDNQYS
jgi:hypothetical protein